MIKVAAAGLLILATCLSAEANAETVYVRSGQQEGQGWAFLDATGCWAATAGHIVRDDGAGVIVIGANGVEALVDRIVRDPSHDLALLHLVGTLAHSCPPSSIGDRDVQPLLDRVRLEPSRMVFERREAKVASSNISYGVESVPMQLLGISDTTPTFTVRTDHARGDDLHATDSGGPIRYRGSGIGEAGLPLGIVIQIQSKASESYVVALRMDAVRSFFESRAVGASGPSEDAAPFQIVAFHGDTRDTACGPLNLLATAAPCGWRARSSNARSIEMVVDVGIPQPNITGVALRFAPSAIPESVSVWTASDVSARPDWQGEHHCVMPAKKHELTCYLGQRRARGIRIAFFGRIIEVVGLRILSK